MNYTTSSAIDIVYPTRWKESGDGGLLQGTCRMIGQHERLLVLVKTFPVLSGTYGETVCTAGVREDRSWIRLHPVPYSQLREDQRYDVHDWIECRVVKSDKDHRPETFNLFDISDIRHTGCLDREKRESVLRSILLDDCVVHDAFDDIIRQAKTNIISLATFRPTQIIDFLVTKDKGKQNQGKQRALDSSIKQGSLFDHDDWKVNFVPSLRVPYKFSYVFIDQSGKKHTQQVFDIQIGEYYWDCLRDCSGHEQRAVDRVRKRYFDEFGQTDLHFVMGTTHQFHYLAPNPWIIIGVLPL